MSIQQIVTSIRSVPKIRKQYSGGFKMIKQNLVASKNNAPSSKLDKQTIYSKLGFNFTDQMQSVAPSQHEEQYLITNIEHEDCKLKKIYACGENSPLIRTIQIQRNTRQPRNILKDQNSKQIQYFYEPNHINNNQIIVRQNVQIQSKPVPEKDCLVQNQPQYQQKQDSKAGKKKIEQKKSQPISKLPTQKQLLQFKNKYKEYLLTKRDHYYCLELFKIIQKIDFQRYQATSPNQLRVKKLWTGKFHLIERFEQLEKYYSQNKFGLEQLKDFVFYLLTKQFNLNQQYQTLAQTILQQFQEFRKSKNSKRLWKENKISNPKLLQFLFKCKFVDLLLKIDIQEIKKSKYETITYEQYISLLVSSSKNNFHPEKHQRAIIARKQIITNKTNKFDIEKELKKVQTISIPLTNETNKSKVLTIREQKLLEQLTKKHQQQQQLLNYRFKAKPVPCKVADKNLYSQMLAQKKQKQEKTKTELMRNTLQNQKPFKLTQQKKKVTADDYYHYNRQFKARSVPQIVLKPMLQEIQKQQNEKKQKLKQRQQQLLKHSKFPQSMQYLNNYLQLKHQHQLKSKLNSHTFQPSITQQIPDFHKLHKNQISKLENLRMTRTVTQPKEFNLSAKIKRQATYQQKQIITKSPKNKISNQQPKWKNQTTLKYDAMVEKRKLEKQMPAKIIQNQHKNKNHADQLKLQLKRNIITQKRKPVKNSETNHWGEKKQKLIQKIYHETPLLIQRHYERVNGKKVQYIMKPIEHTDQFQTII